MKNTTALLLILFTWNFIFAQNNDGKKVQFSIEERVSFYSVNDQYYILKDTVCHADEGFRVYSGYDIELAQDGGEYVIFRYPKWKSRTQQNSKQKVSIQKKMLLDSLFLASIDSLYLDDSNRSKIYLEIIDSLKVLYDLEKNKRPFHVDIVGRDGLKLALSKETFERLKLEGKITDVYSLELRHSTKLASGFMTIPFKLRPKQDSVNFNMTTDITLGAYVGIKKRISRRENYNIVIPATLGVSYINVGNNETSKVNTENNTSVVPGWTWSTGIIFDFNGFNVGFVCGQDFASGVGDNWLYNKKMWYSFSIGYSFFNNKQ